MSGNSKDRRKFRRRIAREGWVYLPKGSPFRVLVLDGAPLHRFEERPWTEEEFEAMNNYDRERVLAQVIQEI